MAPRTTSKPAAPQIKPAELRRFHQRLATWYQNHGRRDLPWRNTDDPYHIWLSEVMLQQTQVATVLARFYYPFLKTFPTVQDLANAPREKVMKAWEGLGYYRRAGNLHEAAKLVATASLRGKTKTSPRAKAVKGRSNPPIPPKSPRWIASLSARNDADRLAFPNTIDDLLKLPGIGQNTAHAIAAFAYHQPVAILEANVKRVVARIFALQTSNDKELWQYAEQLLNHQHPFDYNQAMMDIGSMICTPKKPSCSMCPANEICVGKTDPERYTTKKAKKETPTREVIIHVREDVSGRLFLERRDAALLGGLYGFPQSPHPKMRSAFSTSPKGEVSPRLVLCAIGEVGATSPLGEVDAPDNMQNLSTNSRAAGEGYLGTVIHVYSHFKLIGHVVCEKTTAKPNSPDWHSREEIAALPLSKLDHKVLQLVENCHTEQKKRPKAVPRRRAH